MDLQRARLRRVILALIASSRHLAACPEPSRIGTSGIRVERMCFSVRLSDGNTCSLVGYLFYQGHRRHWPLQVLVHGPTYDHRYWDVPSVNGHDYSYARFMAARGYAALALDQLGAGESRVPDGDLLTHAEMVSSLHQVLRQLRTGATAAGSGFRLLVLVGHSLGCVSALSAQATYGDADAVVTTGLGHTVPAILDSEGLLRTLARRPRFTLPAKVRTALLYHPPAADPDMIAYDNAHLAEPVSRLQLFSTLSALSDGPAGPVTGPVLAQLGQNDALCPASTAAEELDRWIRASDITVQSLPYLGHAFNTHLDNRHGWKQIDEWIVETLGD